MLQEILLAESLLARLIKGPPKRLGHDSNKTATLSRSWLLLSRHHSEFGSKSLHQLLEGKI